MLTITFAGPVHLNLSVFNCDWCCLQGHEFFPEPPRIIFSTNRTVIHFYTLLYLDQGHYSCKVSNSVEKNGQLLAGGVLTGRSLFVEVVGEYSATLCARVCVPVIADRVIVAFVKAVALPTTSATASGRQSPTPRI